MKVETQEKLMRSYLLGNIPESEAASLEEAFFVDDEKFEQMWEIENLLVDSYVRGRLSTEDRTRFEHHYLASPVHIERVAFARGFIEKADALRAAKPVIEPRQSWFARLTEMMGLSPAAWQVGLAAAMLLLAAASIWLLMDRARLRNEFAELKAENEAQRQNQQSLSEQIANGQDESVRLTSEIERLREERDAALQEVAALPEQPSRRNILSFVLSPIGIRSGSDPQTVTLSERTDIVQLKIRPESDARRFQVGVRTVGGKQFWSQQVNRPRASKSLLTIQIPANKLKVDDYFLTLSALNPKGEASEPTRYYFRVVMIRK